MYELYYSSFYMLYQICCINCIQPSHADYERWSVLVVTDVMTGSCKKRNDAPFLVCTFNQASEEENLRTLRSLKMS